MVLGDDFVPGCRLAVRVVEGKGRGARFGFVAVVPHLEVAGLVRPRLRAADGADLLAVAVNGERAQARFQVGGGGPRDGDAHSGGDGFHARGGRRRSRIAHVAGFRVLAPGVGHVAARHPAERAAHAFHRLEAVVAEALGQAAVEEPDRQLARVAAIVAALRIDRDDPTGLRRRAEFERLHAVLVNRLEPAGLLALAVVENDGYAVRLGYVLRERLRAGEHGDDARRVAVHHVARPHRTPRVAPDGPRCAREFWVPALLRDGAQRFEEGALGTVLRVEPVGALLILHEVRSVQCRGVLAGEGLPLQIVGVVDAVATATVLADDHRANRLGVVGEPDANEARLELLARFRRQRQVERRRGGGAGTREKHE